MSINNSHWQSNEIIIFCCKYYIVVSDVLVGFFLDVVFFLLLYYHSFMRDQEGIKIELQKKGHRKICVRDIKLLAASPHSMSFLLPYSSTTLPKWRTYWITPTKIYTAMGCILSNVENMKNSCNLIISGWHLWERNIILDFFGFRYSSCDLIIIKSHTLNCCSFLLRHLLKTKCYKLVVGNSGSSIYC